MCTVGTDVNATDAHGVTPLHLALSRLKMLGERERREGVEEGGGRGMGAGGGVPLFRKKERTQVSHDMRLDTNSSSLSLLFMSLIWSLLVSYLFSLPPPSLSSALPFPPDCGDDQGVSPFN